MDSNVSSSPSVVHFTANNKAWICYNMWVQLAIIPRYTLLPYGGRPNNEAVLARELILTPDVMGASQGEIFEGRSMTFPHLIHAKFPSQSVSYNGR